MAQKQDPQKNNSDIIKRPKATDSKVEGPKISVAPSQQEFKAAPEAKEHSQRLQHTTHAEHQPKKHFAEHYHLPSAYHTTSITLIARDPHWIYAYWEIAPSSLENIRQQLGYDFDRSSYVLRMYDVTYIDFNGFNANRWFDIEVGPGANNWYINLWNDNSSYCADLGIRAPDGRFFTIARSNFVTTPRASSSNRHEAVWMEVKDEAAQQPYVFVQTEQGRKNNPSSKNNPRAKNIERPFRRKRIFLTEDDIRLYYSRLFPLLRRVISSRLRREGKRFNIYLADNDIFLDEVLIGGISKKRFMRRLLKGASEELVVFEGASEKHVAASEQKKQQRKFFFEIGTELIVYGRTEPDAEVWLGDKKIKLRPDGTFSLRFALPDGKIPLDFSAISSDKVDKREIKTSVERAKTIYNP